MMGKKWLNCVNPNVLDKSRSLYHNIREILNSPHLGISMVIWMVCSLMVLFHGWASWIAHEKGGLGYGCIAKGIEPSAFKCNHFREEVS